MPKQSFLPAVVSMALLLAEATLAGSPARADKLTLTRDGQPASALVLPDDPSPAAKQAAAILRDHVRAISGALLPVMREKDLNDVRAEGGKLISNERHLPETLVLVGEGRLTALLGLNSDGLGPGGICLETFPNALALFGSDAKTPNDPWGTLYATITLLEEPLGCRYLWPGALGKVIPKQATITVADLHIRRTPRILQRRIRNSHYSDRLQVGLDRLGFSRADYERAFRDAIRTDPALPDWFQWQRLGGKLNLNAGHAFGSYWKDYGREHPDWFAMQPNGSRDQSLAPDRCRFCVTNTELIDEIARRKLAQLEADPSANSVSICPNDGGRLTFCMCDRCKKLDPPEGRKIQLAYCYSTGGKTRQERFEYVSLTDRMVTFFNAIAERVTRVRPDALLVTYAYSAYSAPPLHVKLHPNIVVGFVPMSYANDTARANALRDWDAWSHAASKIYYRPNCLLAGYRIGTLLVYAQKMGEDLRYLAGHGMIGTDFDSCVHNWATQGLNYYVTARMLWNPEADPTELVDDYCQAGFGPAAGPICQYFQQIEELTNQIARNEWRVEAPYSPETVDRLQRLLDAADKAAAGNDDVLKRIAWLRQGLKFTDSQAQAYRLLEDPSGTDRAVARRLLDTRYEMMRNIFEKDHLAVNVACTVFKEGGTWKRLGWNWTVPHDTPATRTPANKPTP